MNESLYLLVVDLKGCITVRAHYSMTTVDIKQQ